MRRIYSQETGNISVPTLDASLGLIFRLNGLWQKVDIPASNGDNDRWNFLLDRIFCNLLYKNELNVRRNKEGKIEVQLCEDDKEVYEYLNKKVIEAREQIRNAKTKEEFNEAKSNLYQALIMKDVGLRKFMHIRLKLYLKEFDRNPARAMWGG